MYYIFREKEVCNMIFLEVDCNALQPIISVVKAVVSVFQFVIPVLLILFGLIDLGKAVIAGKEDEMKKAQGTLIKRIIYAVAVFFVVTIVVFVMGIIGRGSSSAWYRCYTDTTTDVSNYLDNQ